MIFRRYAFQIAGAVVAVVYLILGIFKSTNSTASVGFLFIPFFAAFGAFLGDALKYFSDLIQKKRAHSPMKTVIILIVLGFCAYRLDQSRTRERDLKRAENPATSKEELVVLLNKNIGEITHAVAANPSLPVSDLDALVNKYLYNYHVINGALRHPQLSPQKMELIASLDRKDFDANADYRVYQTYVWASLVRRKDIPEELVHKLAAKENPQHFFIIALLESPYVTCAEKQKFLPQENEVLANMIHQSMVTQQCTR